MNSFANAYTGRRVLVTGHTGFKGAWLALWLQHLGAAVARELLLRANVDPKELDAVICGCVGQPFDAANVGHIVQTITNSEPRKLLQNL